MTRVNESLIKRVKEIAPGYVMERDGGDWYLCSPSPDQQRLAEGFSHRATALKCLLWLAGDPLPEGWSITDHSRLALDIDCEQGYPATIWVREAALEFPNRIVDVLSDLAKERVGETAILGANPGNAGERSDPDGPGM